MNFRTLKKYKTFSFTVIIILVIYYCSKEVKTQIENNFIVITVKTAFRTHNTRIAQIVDTWFQLAPENIYFITDAYDPVLEEKVKEGHLVNTTCGYGYDFPSVGCKLNEELKIMVKKNAKWSCHFDDDNYVNVPVLKQILYNFNPDIPYYLGRTATHKPTIQNGRMFWFATGGAGFCISNAALQKLKPSILKNELYEDYAKHDNMPDDMAFGYMMDSHKIRMTEMVNFLSQYDRLDLLPLRAIKDTPIFSFKERNNTFINLPHFFNPRLDPYKFQTLHCFLHPNKCNQNLKRLRIDVYTNPKLQTNSFGSFALPTIKF